MSSFYEQREIRSGCSIQTKNLRSLAPGLHVLVIATACPGCRCDGYEVHAETVDLLEDGRYTRAAIFPCLSAVSVEQAVSFSRQLRKACRDALSAWDNTEDPSIEMARRVLENASRDLAVCHELVPYDANNRLYRRKRP
jgi:hypothetical protein